MRLTPKGFRRFKSSRLRQSGREEVINASDVLNLLVEDYPHMVAIKTFTTGSPAVADFNINATNHFLSLTYTASELEKDSEYKSINDVEKALERIGDKYDLVFVDPWHTFGDSLKGLQIALKYVKPNGFIVVHDCLTLEASMSANYVPGAWSGVTAIVFRDVVSKLNRNWCVVDSNHGIGIIGPEYGPEIINDSPINSDWANASLDYKVRIFYEDPYKLMRAIAPSQVSSAIRNLKLFVNAKQLSAEYCFNPHQFKFNRANSEIERLHQELVAIKNSRIWKITTPYRRFKSKLNSLIQLKKSGTY